MSKQATQEKPTKVTQQPEAKVDVSLEFVLDALADLESRMSAKMSELEDQVKVISLAILASQLRPGNSGTTVNSGRRLFGTYREAKPVLDTKTGKAYRSKAAAGKAVAAEYGLDDKKSTVWYEVIGKDPGRFRELTPDEASKLEKVS